MGYDTKVLYAGAVSVRNGRDQFNAPSEKVRFLSTQGGGEEFFRISVNQQAENTRSELTTVENITNAIGVHEYTGHGIFNYNDNDKTHHKAYELQFSDPTWTKTTSMFQTRMVERYDYYLGRERRLLYNNRHKSLEKFYKK